MSNCLNCEAPLTGTFCSQCGQKNSRFDASFWRVAFDAVREAFELDGRMFRTARAFFSRPGFLVREYLAGRRVRYTSPLRLFIFAALVSFFVLKVLGPTMFIDFGLDETPAESSAESDTSAASTDDEDGLFAWFRESISKNIDGLRRYDKEERRERISDAVFDALPTALAFMLPFFAFALKLLYRRRRYIEHLIFGLNIHSVGLVFLALAIPWNIGYAVVLALLLTQVHLIVGLRRVYENTWPWTVAKYVGLLGIYTVLLAATYTGALLLALLQI